MSDTPRTDRYTGNAEDYVQQRVVPATFAGQLERELAAARKEHDKWRAAWRESTERLVNRAEKAEAELAAAREEISRLRSVLNYQGRKDDLSKQMGAPFDEDLQHRMEAGHA